MTNKEPTTIAEAITTLISLWRSNGYTEAELIAHLKDIKRIFHNHGATNTSFIDAEIEKINKGE